MKKYSMKNKEMKGGIFGIPSFGILKSKDPTSNSIVPVEPSSSSTDMSTKNILDNSSPAGQVASNINQEEIDNKRKACILEQDEKIKQANEAKKQCNIEFPAKKIFGLFGGKKTNKKRSNRKRCKNKTKCKKGKKSKK